MEEDEMLPLDSLMGGMNGVTQGLQQFAEQMMQMQQMQMQMMQQLSAQMQQLAQIAAAPSELVYDEMGRPVQGRKVLPQAQVMN